MSARTTSWSRAGPAWDHDAGCGKPRTHPAPPLQKRVRRGDIRPHRENCKGTAHRCPPSVRGTFSGRQHECSCPGGYRPGPFFSAKSDLRTGQETIRGLRGREPSECCHGRISFTANWKKKDRPVQSWRFARNSKASLGCQNSHSLLKTLVATQLHLHGLCIQRSHKEGQSRMRTLGESNKIPRSHL